MRLFVAAELDDAVRQRAAEIAAKLRHADQAGGRRSVAWVARENLHFTLQFIGEVDSPTAQRIAEQLVPPFDLPAFEVTIAGVGTFPPSGPPRVVWLGVTEGGAPLAAVARAVNQRLDAMGVPRDDRPFRAHLTVGRVKAPTGPRFREALAAARDAAVGRCPVDRVTLFESRLSPRGSTYSVVATSPLGYDRTS
jgi:RNA 2',3'-cyclic 3'-phosphodiesterase